MIVDSHVEASLWYDIVALGDTLIRSLHVGWGRTGFEVIGPGSWKEIWVKLGWKVYRNNLIVKDDLKEGTWTLLR